MSPRHSEIAGPMDSVKSCGLMLGSLAEVLTSRVPYRQEKALSPRRGGLSTEQSRTATVCQVRRSSAWTTREEPTTKSHKVLPVGPQATFCLSVSHWGSKDKEQSSTQRAS